VSFNADLTLASLALTFEQHCNGATAALLGELRFKSSLPLRHAPTVAVDRPIKALADGSLLQEPPPPVIPKAVVTFLVILDLTLLAIALVEIVSLCFIFRKAGRPAWTAVVPVYNAIVLCRIVGRPAWWAALFFVPVVNLVFVIIVRIRLSKSFGRDNGFAVGLILVGFVFYPILAFGRAQYIGPVSSGRGPGAVAAQLCAAKVPLSLESTEPPPERPVWPLITSLESL